jgi:hypothetical protein
MCIPGTIVQPVKCSITRKLLSKYFFPIACVRIFNV